MRDFFGEGVGACGLEALAAEAGACRAANARRVHAWVQCHILCPERKGVQSEGAGVLVQCRAAVCVLTSWPKHALDAVHGCSAPTHCLLVSQLRA